MSDGNFNRSLLPHTPFYNGLLIGRKQERARIVEVIRDFLQNNMNLTEEESKIKIEQILKKLNNYN